ncbi:alpha/beta hydrolase [Lacrimispora sp.]|uniref:alpha/beta hydrolase n=1 Tax=Lacrimispora sp. TaxID=2719234 RepID=UPI0028A8DE49|nr:alpha/beta hydrolase-fold protein [Lacrimispora sp.]
MNLEYNNEASSIIEAQWENHKIIIYLPPSWNKQESTTYPAILVQDGDQALKAVTPVLSELEKLWKDEKGREFILAMICPLDRLSEYTPWPAHAMSSRFPDFKGKGNEYLASLETQLLPWLSENYKVDLKNVSLLGYSLGGLISVYALTIQICWRHVAGICSSFWYDGWMSWIESKNISKDLISLSLHYGTGEGSGKSGPMERAAEYAEKTGELLSQRWPGKVTVTKDDGGHHSFAGERYRNGLLWLNEQIGSS